MWLVLVIICYLSGCCGVFVRHFQGTFCAQTDASYYYKVPLGAESTCEEKCRERSCTAVYHFLEECYFLQNCDWQKVKAIANIDLYYMCSVSAFNAIPNTNDVDGGLTDGKLDTCVSLTEQGDTWGFTSECPGKVNATLVLTFKNRCDMEVEVFIVDRTFEFQSLSSSNPCSLKLPRRCTRVGEPVMEEYSGILYCSMSFVCVSGENLHLDKFIINKPYLTLCEMLIK